MKIRLWSDIHCEFGAPDYNKTPEDHEVVLVIAGDFTVGVQHEVLLRELCDHFKAVVFVCGNHEYYQNEIYAVDLMYRMLADEITNLHFLQGDYAIIDDVRFIGGTFWTDMGNNCHKVKQLVRHRMNDYSCIKIDDMYDSIRYIKPDDIFEINKRQRAKLIEFLETPFDGKTVIVTHHAPLDICLNPMYTMYAEDRMVNFAYYNHGIDEWFDKYDFTHWLHGHIHYRNVIDYKGKTIINNCRGYVGHEAIVYSWEDDKVFDI